MATRTRIPSNDIENIEKHKSTLIAGKQTTLINKLPSRRPALGDRTNREVPKLNAPKPVLKKPLTITLQNVKPKLIVPLKPSVTTFKHPAKEAKKPSDDQEQKLQPAIPSKPAEKKSTAYSVQHFGLVEENDTDPLLVPTYVNDIVVYLRNLEQEYTVKDMFLAGHKTTSRMRCVLVNWLVEVHLNFKLVQETLFLCISIVDRYLQKNKTVGRDNLQLVGIAALFIASKYEEIYAPEVEDLVYICDDLFNKKKICQMEQSIIKTLGFKFGSPCALHFLRRYSKVGKVEPSHHVLAKYLIESALIEHDFSYVAPSLVAAAAICLAIRLLCPQNADHKAIHVIEHISGYKQKAVAPVIKSLASFVLRSETSKYQAVRTKYSAKNFCSISTRTELKNGLIKELAES